MFRRLRLVATAALVTAVCFAFAGSLAAQPEERPNRNRRGEKPEQARRIELQRQRARARAPEGREAPILMEQRRGRDGIMMRRFFGRRIEDIVRRVEEGGQVEPEQERWLEQYLKENLLRSPSLNAIESAHYAVAEIYLRRQDHAKCAERLRKVVEEAGERQDEAVWISHLNIANVCRRHLGDMQRALKEYKLVKGGWAAYAERELLGTYEEMGKLEDAIKILDGQYKAAAEKGEKLALLRRIAELYLRNDEEGKAIAAYDRIAKEFSAKDIVEMKKSAAEFVKKNADKVIALHEVGKHDEAERLTMETRRRLGTLKAQGRTDEAESMEKAMRAAMERIEQWHRERRGRDRRDDRDDDRPPPEARDDGRPPPER